MSRVKKSINTISNQNKMVQRAIKIKETNEDIKQREIRNKRLSKNF